MFFHAFRRTVPKENVTKPDVENVRHALKFRPKLLFCAALALAAAGCSGGGGMSAPTVTVPSQPAAAASASPTPAPSVAKLTPAATVTATPTATATAAATATPTATARPSATPVPTPAPIPTIISTSEVPFAADALADAVGLNDHTSTNYVGSDFSTIVSLEQSLGVRHLRDGILNGMTSYEAALNQLLNATGAKVDGITDCAGIEQDPTSPTSPASIQQFQSSLGNRMESVESPNEPDLRGDSNWVADTKACLPSLASALPNLPFLAPALGDPNENAYTLGNISALVTEGNFHRYFSGRNPGTGGWGGSSACGVYGALSWALCLAQVESGTEPLVVTETGWNSQDEVDELTQAKYLSRVFFVNLKAGVAHTYIYDLKDYTGQDNFYGNGLIRTDDSQKPSFAAVKNLISVFADPGAVAATSALPYSLTNQNLDHALFQRHDGTYILALWNETSSWNPNTNTETVVPAQSETIDLEIPPSTLSAQALTDTGSFAAKAVTVAGAAVTLPVDDHITLVTFKF